MRLSVLLVLTGLSACSKPSEGGAPPAPVVPASAPVKQAPPPKPAAPATSSWTGTYKAAPGPFYVPEGPEWKGVHFRGEDASTALGEGPMTVTFDPKDNRLHGTASGPIGDVTLSGAITKGEYAFTVARKDPRDRGPVGTGVATLAAEALTGTLRLSAADGRVLREAPFHLTRKPD